MTDPKELIERLNDWISRDAHNGYSKTNALIEEAATALSNLSAAREGERVDALRYRWLRNPARLHTIMAQQFSPKPMDLHGDELDSAIDRARHCP